MNSSLQLDVDVGSFVGLLPVSIGITSLYVRVDFAAVKARRSTALDQFANKAICIKGYMLPPSRSGPMRTIHFSPDGDGEISENIITVTLSFESEYQQGPLAISGILTVNPNAKDSALRYVLAAEAVRRSRTSHGLVLRASNGC